MGDRFTLRVVYMCDLPSMNVLGSNAPIPISKLGEESGGIGQGQLRKAHQNVSMVDDQLSEPKHNITQHNAKQRP